MQKRVLMGLVITVGLLGGCMPTQTASSTSSKPVAPPSSGPVDLGPVDISIVGINDFHGNLESTGPLTYTNAAGVSTKVDKPGGVAHMSGVLKELRAKQPNTIFVGGGDLIGASPLASSLLRDEPTIVAMNTLGMEVSVLGNHEFDYGKTELLRFQNGGCASNDTAKACKFNASFPGAKFKYIAANVTDTASGKTLFPPFFIKEIAGVKVAFVGAVLKETPTIVVPSGVAGLTFSDEAASINAQVAEIKKQGAETIIALVHQGGSTKEALDKVDCTDLSGSIVDIVKKLDKSIDAVMTGHTHQGYQCRIDGRLVTQGSAFGRLMTTIDLKVDRKTGDVLSTSSQNIVVDSSKVAADPALTALVNQAKTLTDPIAKQPIGKLGVKQILRAPNTAGESSLGDVIADSQLAATKDAAKGGAVIAFMNPGGIRADLPAAPSETLDVSYGDGFTVQPFGNTVVVKTLTGKKIDELLEQQFDNPAAGQNRILQVSSGFSYTWDNAKPKGEKVDASSIKLNGTVLGASANYRVTMNSFLADGGDSFTTFKAGTNALGGDLDLDALIAFIRAGTVQAGPQNRITRVN